MLRPTGCYSHDRTGFKSDLGKAAKDDAGIEVLEIPKRSPDLSVCDYAVWIAVSRAMRKQEKNFPPSRTETRSRGPLARST